MSSMLTACLLSAVVTVINAAPQAAYYPIPARHVAPPGPPPPVVSPDVNRPTSHGPFSGVPTTTGALSLSVQAPSIPALPPNPTATTYISDGQLHDPQPAPYVPAGGLGTNGTEPVYNAKSDYDYQSLVRDPQPPDWHFTANDLVGIDLVSGVDRIGSVPSWSRHILR